MALWAKNLDFVHQTLSPHRGWGLGTRLGIGTFDTLFPSLLCTLDAMSEQLGSVCNEVHMHHSTNQQDDPMQLSPPTGDHFHNMGCLEPQLTFAT